MLTLDICRDTIQSQVDISGGDIDEEKRTNVRKLLLHFALSGQRSKSRVRHNADDCAVIRGNGDHRIRNGDLPVGKDVLREIQELGGQLVEDLTFVGNAFRKNYVEGRNAVGSHHDQVATVKEVNVADFSRVLGFLTGKAEIGFYNGFHDI